MTITPLKYINSHAAQLGMVIDKVKWVILSDALLGFIYLEVGIGF